MKRRSKPPRVEAAHSPESSTPAAARASLEPIAGAQRSLRRRLTLKDEFILATFPTLVVLAVLGLAEAVSRQRVLFASLASSAFLIYLDPQHGANSVRSIVGSHLAAALIGAGLEAAFGAGYGTAAAAMVLSIIALIAADVVHPPSVGTALTFAFRPTDVTVLSLFVLCVAAIATLVVVQQVTLRILSATIARRK